MYKLACLSVHISYSILAFIWLNIIWLSVHNYDFENLIYKKVWREDIDYSDGQDLQNMWLVLRFEKYALSCFTVFVEYYKGVLNHWARATHCHLRIHPDSNGGGNIQCRTIWTEYVVELPLLMSNFISRNAMCILRKVSIIHIYTHIQS
jgi:hypothetical protein